MCVCAFIFTNSFNYFVIIIIAVIFHSQTLIILMLISWHVHNGSPSDLCSFWSSTVFFTVNDEHVSYYKLHQSNTWKWGWACKLNGQPVLCLPVASLLVLALSCLIVVNWMQVSWDWPRLDEQVSQTLKFICQVVIYCQSARGFAWVP